MAGWFNWTRKKRNISPVSTLPNAKQITATRLGYGLQTNNATTTRALASGATTAAAASIGAVWATTAGLSTAQLAAAFSVGAAVTVPALAPAILGVIVASIFVMRQNGLNKELISNLYFIKMEVERMGRIHNVMKEISKDSKINLNTASLAICMSKLKDKIILFSDSKTKKDIGELESFLKQGNIQAAQDIIAKAEKDSEGRLLESIGKNPYTKWWPTGWSARWLSPDETMRQIIRDITVATVWFSVMLGEFDIFMRFMNIQGGEQKTDWTRSEAMKELLMANKQLGLTTPVNKSNNVEFNVFYNILELQKAVEDVSDAAENPDAVAPASEEHPTNPSRPPTPPFGDTRRRR
jgi:hypothetical protein